MDSMDWGGHDDDLGGSGFGFPQFNASFLESGSYTDAYGADESEYGHYAVHAHADIPKRYASSQRKQGNVGVSHRAAMSMDVEEPSMAELFPNHSQLWEQDDEVAYDDPSRQYRPPLPVQGFPANIGTSSPMRPVKEEPGMSKLSSAWGATGDSAYSFGRTSTEWSSLTPKAEQQHDRKTINSVLKILEQPPVEVRTRTPGENRTFSVKLELKDAEHVRFVHARLYYADDPSSQALSILGGVSRLAPNGGVLVFENLSLSEASTKHEEREFCLGFDLELKTGGLEQTDLRTSSFYAYSHKKVLNRRKNVELRALSRNSGPVSGGGEMHLVGMPFIKGPSLQCIFRTPNGQTEIRFRRGLERYSDTVLFFPLPPCPEPIPAHMLNQPLEIRTAVFVSNDGRNYSNSLEFTYYTGGQ